MNEASAIMGALASPFQGVDREMLCAKVRMESCNLVDFTVVNSFTGLYDYTGSQNLIAIKLSLE